MRYGLLGETLNHSISPAIHKAFGNLHYQLFPLPFQEVDAFIKAGNWQGINVTIPYKKEVLPYCQSLSPQAKKIGAVNTLLRQEDGTIYGDNTDYEGFLYMAKEANISFTGKIVAILGQGGTGKMAEQVMRDTNAKEVIFLSRRGPITYETKGAYRHCEIIVNTTPVGMAFQDQKSLVDLKDFPQIEGVLDVIYNPLMTPLLKQAKALSIPWNNGLSMLVEQARYSEELFLGKEIPSQKTLEVIAAMTTILSTSKNQEREIR